MTQQNGNSPAGEEKRRHVRSLGSLESLLMGVLWDAVADLSVQEVVDRLGPNHNYKTVMTVLNRLVEKDLLGRELDGRAYRYRPAEARADFLRSVADEVINDYVGSYGESAASYLANAVDAVAPRLERVEPERPIVVQAAPPPAVTQRPSFLAMMGAAIALELVLLVLLRGRRR